MGVSLGREDGDYVREYTKFDYEVDYEDYYLLRNGSLIWTERNMIF